jgi:uncharacterized protein (TIGR02284 family)
MTSNSRDTTVLNTLIATLIDSIDGYQKSAEDIHNAGLGEKFRARAQERQTVVAQLRATVSAAGGNPEDDGTILASAHRAFLDLKEAVVGRDDKAIINEVERGEDYLKEKFETAKADADLSPTARAAIDRAWDSVQAGHAEMSALKHSIN